MTVRELRELLATLPDEAVVAVTDECGDPYLECEQSDIKLTTDSLTYEPWRATWRYEYLLTDRSKVTGVLI